VLEQSNVPWYKRFFNNATAYVPIRFPDVNNKLVTAQVRLAPEPSDVFWENMHYSKRERTVRSFFSWLFVIALLAVCFSLIFILALKQDRF
jgi:hypothetical protein